MSQAVYCMPLPAATHYAKPLSRMPLCPHCGENELSLISPDRAVCNACLSVVVRHTEGMSIMEVPAVCPECPWLGRVEQCECGKDGDLLCPQCRSPINIVTFRNLFVDEGEQP